MSQMKEVVIGSDRFILTQAVAMKQKTLMMLIGNQVSYKTAAARVEIDQRFLEGVLLSIDESKLDQIADIVLEDCVIKGSTERVDVSFFQGKIFSFLQLVAQGVAYNLEDFFTHLNSVVKELSRAQNQLSKNQAL
jgi:hypothetical protein